MQEKSRRGFLKALAKKSQPKRLPYWQNLDDFTKICPSCEEKPCINVCDEGIIFLHKNTPSISFKDSGCTYCDECARVCEKNVLHVKSKKHINVTLSIDTSKCLAWNGVICSTCKDNCDENAIEFFGLFRPLINDKCTSCGFCVSPCPANALKER